MAATVTKKMRAAYRDTDPLPTQAALEALARDLKKSHPGAAGSLAEGLAETLTVSRLDVPPHPGPHPPVHQCHLLFVFDPTAEPSCSLVATSPTARHGASGTSQPSLTRTTSNDAYLTELRDEGLLP